MAWFSHYNTTCVSAFYNYGVTRISDYIKGMFCVIYKLHFTSHTVYSSIYVHKHTLNML